jgi:hypothetical protein
VSARCLLVCTLLAGVVHAQSPAAPATAPPATAQQAARCAGLQEDAARLACYDVLFRPTPAVVEAGFGLERRDPTPSDALATIASPIVDIERLRDGMVRVTLENGQVWRQTEGARPSQWRAGDTLRIERASLGSFLAAVEGSKRYVRVRRER